MYKLVLTYVHLVMDHILHLWLINKLVVF